MLKYQININNLFSDRTLLPITDYKCLSYVNSEGEMMDVICEYKTDINLHMGDNILVQTPKNNSAYDYYREEITIKEIDESESNFTFTLPIYINLNLYSLSEKKEVDTIESIDKPFWWYFNFSEPHYFNGDNVTINIQYYTTNGIMEKVELQNCVVVNTKTLKYNFNKENSEIEKFGISIFGEYEDGVNIARGDADIMNLLNVRRKNFLITNDSNTVKFYKYEHKLSINVPLTDSSKTDLMQQYAVNEKFVDVEMEKAINKGVEMEKNIFTPVFKNADDDDKEIYKINFNLHLRNHSNDDEWKTTDDDYWNGVYVELDEDNNKILNIDDNFFSSPYVDEGKWSWQSDNLNLLGFNIADVKYQKSRLKKTFLRLSFYDSPYIADQNLIGYSTVFLDTNKLFGSFTKNLKTSKYKIYNKTGEPKENLFGIGVNKELGDGFKNLLQKNVKFSEVEEYRLSSQFSVEDRYSNSDCSEGFYVYLWKDYTQGTMPSDLYLHIDLNHARFGRSIPLMMPYFGTLKNEIWDGSCENSWGVKTGTKTLGVKSFHDIVRDWQEDAGGYTMQRYLRYSFIHLKCQFDKDKNRYVYYLDNKHYGDNLNKIFDEETNTLNLVLYEAKVSTGKDIAETNSGGEVEPTLDTYVFKILYKDLNNTDINNNEITISNNGGTYTIRAYVFLQNENTEEYSVQKSVKIKSNTTINKTDGLWSVPTNKNGVFEDYSFNNTKLKFKYDVDNTTMFIVDKNIYGSKIDILKKNYSQYVFDEITNQINNKISNIVEFSYELDDNYYIYDNKGVEEPYFELKNESNVIVGYKLKNGTPCDENGRVYKTTPYKVEYWDNITSYYYRLFNKESDGSYKYINGTLCDENGYVINDGEIQNHKLFKGSDNDGIYEYIDGTLCDKNGYVCEYVITYKFSDLEKQKTNNNQEYCNVIDTNLYFEFLNKSQYKYIKENKNFVFKQKLAPKLTETIIKNGSGLTIDKPQRTFTVSQTTNNIIETNMTFDINAYFNEKEGKSSFKYELWYETNVFNQVNGQSYYKYIDCNIYCDNEGYVFAMKDGKIYNVVYSSSDGTTQLIKQGDATSGYYYKDGENIIPCDENGYVYDVKDGEKYKLFTEKVVGSGIYEYRQGVENGDVILCNKKGEIYTDMFISNGYYNISIGTPSNEFNYNTALTVTPVDKNLDNMTHWQILRIKLWLGDDYNKDNNPQFIKIAIIPSEAQEDDKGNIKDINYYFSDGIEYMLYKNKNDKYSYQEGTEGYCKFGQYMIKPKDLDNVNYELLCSLIDKENITYELTPSNGVGTSLSVDANIFKIGFKLPLNASSLEEYKYGKTYTLNIKNTKNQKTVDVDIVQETDIITYELNANISQLIFDFDEYGKEVAKSIEVTSKQYNSLSNPYPYGEGLKLSYNEDIQEYYSVGINGDVYGNETITIYPKQKNETYKERKHTLILEQINKEDNVENKTIQIELIQKFDESKKYNFFNFE